jgi:threonine dehydrogenase-like Zn-dependent dehydrogenase
VGARVVGECILGCGACDACRQGGPTTCEGRREVGVLRKDGAYATQVAMPVEALHAVPPGLPLLYASLAEPLAVINKALRKAPHLRGRRCAVVGAGPIGHLSALVLRDRGADALVIDLDEGRPEPLRKMDFSTAAEITAEALSDREVVIEATGSEAALKALAVAPSGSIVLAVGRPGADGATPPAAPANGGARFVGTLGSDPVDWPAAIELLESGRLSIHMLAQHVADLEEYDAAWEAVRDRSRLKTILRVDEALAHA